MYYTLPVESAAKALSDSNGSSDVFDANENKR
jgi:hypothetical protein